MTIEGMVVMLVLGFGFIGAGGFVMKRAFDRRNVRQLIEETPTSEIESLAIGPAEVGGVAHPEGETIPAPFTDEECLVAIWKVEEYRTTTDSKGNTKSEWRTLGSGTECVPFVVEDDTGRLLVEPDDSVIFDVGDELKIKAGRGDDVPASFHEFRRYKESHRQSGFLSDLLSGSVSGGSNWRKRRYTQRLIRPGETVYVFGTVQTRDGSRSSSNAENLVIRRVPKGDEDLEPLFLVSNRSEADLVSSRRWALVGFPLGALLSTAGLGILLYALFVG